MNSLNSRCARQRETINICFDKKLISKLLVFDVLNNRNGVKCYVLTWKQLYRLLIIFNAVFNAVFNAWN